MPGKWISVSGMIGLAILGLYVLGWWGLGKLISFVNEAPIEYTSITDPAEKEKVRQTFISWCKTGAQFSASSWGQKVDGDSEEKMGFTCGCAANEVLPRISGISLGEYSRLPYDDPVRRDVETIVQRCARQMGLVSPTQNTFGGSVQTPLGQSTQDFFGGGKQKSLWGN